MSDKKEIVSASPKVRKLAREFGADIYQIQGSQREGRVSEEDVKRNQSEQNCDGDGQKGDLGRRAGVGGYEVTNFSFGQNPEISNLMQVAQDC